MRFEFRANGILQRNEFHWDAYPWGVCRLLSQMFRLCLNIFVLALVLTWIDFYFTKSSSTHLAELVKLNALVAFSGLASLRIIFVALNNLFAMVLFSVVFSKHNYETNIKIFALISCACIVYFVKYHTIPEAGLIFSNPVSIIILQVFLVLSLRSSVNSYGMRCL